jgi:hypothetical protein
MPVGNHTLKKKPSQAKAAGAIVFDIEISALPLEDFDEVQQEYLFQNWISTRPRSNP